MDRRSNSHSRGISVIATCCVGALLKNHTTSPLYYLNRAWSNSANWNGLTGSESNIELSQDFITLLKNWDEGNYPIGGIPTIDENGLPILHLWKPLDISLHSTKCLLTQRKTICGLYCANDILVNGNLTQNDGYLLSIEVCQLWIFQC